ncbi:hypothetical protein [Pedobacter sp.]|uniref:hypothetical protein n=1 Tax=Pedobacter sp. TaxID=1411316 RepID=UPI0031DBD63E
MDKFEIELNYEEMHVVLSETKIILEEFINDDSFKVKTALPLITKINYNERELELDYRNKKHFFMALLISIYNLFNKSIKRNGHVYFYNRNLLNFNSINGFIISMLKSQKSMSIEELMRAYMLSEKSESISRVDIDKDLNQLIELGYVDYQELSYIITAKGSTLFL